MPIQERWDASFSAIAVPEDQFTIEKLFAAWMRLRTPDVTAADRDEFARFIARVIIQVLNHKKWEHALARAEIDREEAATRLLPTIVKRCSVARLQHPCERVLISVVNTAIARELLTMLRGRRPPIASIDRGDDEGRVRQYADVRQPEANLAQFAREMAAAGERFCGKNARLLELWNMMVESLVGGRGTPRFNELALPTRQWLSIDGFLIVVFNLNSAIRQAVANVAN